ncbi:MULTISPECIES: cupredoxin domain-containing protein [Cohnella]|uniref:cupredoxin domain-containing protein n=1 Tax=Cohnella TaxID=329857 RepID=UPI00257FD412|nr:cupredoxin domain-containing protein [Cohnella sp.]
MTKGWGVLTGWMIAAALALTACGGGDAGGQAGGASSSQPASSASSAAAGSTKAITVKASNFKFDQTEIKVAKGETIALTLENEQGNHSLKIDGYDKTVKGGKTVTFTADRTGEFKFYCDVMCGSGHADMVGKLIVE